MLDKFLKRIGGKRSAQPKPERPASELPPIVDLTDADFASVVEQAATLAVVDFWADWCEPCHIMSAYVGFLAQEYTGRVLVAALDVDENPETPSRFSVMGLPTLLLLQDGREVDRVVGVIPYEEIKARIDRLLVDE